VAVDDGVLVTVAIAAPPDFPLEEWVDEPLAQAPSRALATIDSAITRLATTSGARADRSRRRPRSLGLTA
jgi:hypothetical protein